MAKKKRAAKKKSNQESSATNEENAAPKATRKKTTKKSSGKVTKKARKKSSAKKNSPTGVKESLSTRLRATPDELTIAERLYLDVPEPGVETSKQRPLLTSTGRSFGVSYLAPPAELRLELRQRKTELEKERKQAQKVLRQHVLPRIRTGDFGNVTGYSVGFRLKNDRIVSPLQYVIRIAVRNKYRLSTLSRRKIETIPQEVDGILIKVVESRPNRGRRTDSDEPVPGTVMPSGGTSEEDLLELGDSQVSILDTEVWGGLPTVEMNTDDWGTLGICLPHQEQTCGLVNAHFASQNAMRFVQPPVKPEGDLTGWEIGLVVGTFEGSFRRAHVDAALVEFDTVRATRNWVISFGSEEFLFANRRLNRAEDNLAKVFKYGAKTMEQLEGYIDDANYEGLEIGGVVLGQVIKAMRTEGSHFTDQGDSGSVLVAPIVDGDEIRLLVVGLCFAEDDRNDEIVYACHFKSVIDALRLELPDHLLRDDWDYD